MVTLEEALHGSKRTVSLRRGRPTKSRNIRSRFRVACTKANAFGSRARGKPERAGEKAAICSCGCAWRGIRIFPSKGSDLIHEVKIEPWQAVLGGELQVPTLEGSARLKLPAGTQAGQRFRLRGHGLPTAAGTRGDLFVVPHIQIPKKLTDREREIWKQLAELRGV